MSEKVTIKVERKKLHLPTIALRGLVVFPNNLVHFEVGREKSIAAVEWAMANNSNVFLVAQKSMDTTEPQQADLFSYGVVAEVKQVLRVSGDLVKVLVEGKYRAKLSALDASGDFLLSEVRPAPVRAGKADDAVETEALLRALKAGFDEYLGMNPRLGKDVVFAIVSSDDPAFLSEYMPANLLFRYEDKQAVFSKLYADFLAVVREKNPQAYILCTVGIMGERIFPAVEEGIKIYLKSHADSKISSMMFHEQDGANDGFAANWHPTEKTHKKAAAVLTEKLREIIKSI